MDGGPRPSSFRDYVRVRARMVPLPPHLLSCVLYCPVLSLGSESYLPYAASHPSSAPLPRRQGLLLARCGFDSCSVGYECGYGDGDGDTWPSDAISWVDLVGPCASVLFCCCALLSLLFPVFLSFLLLHSGSRTERTNADQVFFISISLPISSLTPSARSTHSDHPRLRHLIPFSTHPTNGRNKRTMDKRWTLTHLQFMPLCPNLRIFPTPFNRTTPTHHHICTYISSHPTIHMLICPSDRPLRIFHSRRCVILCGRGTCFDV